MSNISIKNRGQFDEAGMSSACPLCGKKIDLNKAEIVEAEQDPDVVFAICTECGGSLIISSVEQIFGTAVIAIATDLAIGDLQKFSGSDPISSDDILDLYVAIKKELMIKERSSEN